MISSFDAEVALSRREVARINSRTLEVLVNDAEYRLDARDYTGMFGYGRLEEPSLRLQLRASIQACQDELEAREADAVAF